MDSYVCPNSGSLPGLPRGIRNVRLRGWVYGCATSPKVVRRGSCRPVWVVPMWKPVKYEAYRRIMLECRHRFFVNLPCVRVASDTLGRLRLTSDWRSQEGVAQVSDVQPGLLIGRWSFDLLLAGYRGAEVCLRRLKSTLCSGLHGVRR